MVSFLLLEGPLFKRGALDSVLLAHNETLERALTDQACSHGQVALVLLRASFGVAKVTYLLRNAACYGHPLLERMDALLRRGMDEIDTQREFQRHPKATSNAAD